MKQRTRPPLPALLCSAFTFFLFVGIATAGSIRGTVRSAADFSPLSGVNLTVHVLLPDSIPYPTVTDDSGAYEITGIVPDNQIYVVVTYRSGFLPTYTRVDELGSRDLEFNLVLLPDTSTSPPPGDHDSTLIAGSVFESSSGGALQAVAGASVRLISAEGSGEIVTDARGEYQVRLPAGTYVVSVSAEGCDSLRSTGVTVPPEGLTFNAILNRVAVQVEEPPPDMAQKFVLHGAYPNPFNPATTISYELPAPSRVSLCIFDLLGREIDVLVDGIQEAGPQRVRWHATGHASGVYRFRLEALDMDRSQVLFRGTGGIVLVR